MASFVPHSIYLHHLAQAMHGLVTLYPSHVVVLDSNSGSLSPSSSSTSYVQARKDIITSLFASVYGSGKGTISNPITNDSGAPVVSEIVFAGSTKSLPNEGLSSTQIIISPEDLSNCACLSPLELSTDPQVAAFESRAELGSNTKAFRRLYLFFDVHALDTDSNDVVLCKDLPMGQLTLDSVVTLTKSSSTLYEGGTTFCANLLINLASGTGTINISSASELNNTSIYSTIIKDLSQIYSSARSITDQKINDLSLLKSKFTQLLN